MSSITVTQLKYFVAVVESEGFSKAARKINVTQPALTRHIKALEDICGVRLLDRTRTGVYPTDDGRALHAASAKVFADMKAVDNLAASMGRRTVRLKSVSTPKLAEFMRYCQTTLPAVTLDLSISAYEDVLQSLADRRADLGLMTMPDGCQGFEAVELARYDFNAFVPAHHPWASRKSISITELNGRKIVAAPRLRRSRQVFDEHLLRYGVDVEIVHEVAAADTICHLVREDFGIGILPASNGVDVADLIRLDFEERLDIPLHLVALPSGERTRLVNRVFELTARNLAAA